MKKIVLIWVILVTCISIANTKHLFEITSNLSCVRYISNNEIIICGTNGTILKSSDSGENWKYINSNTQFNLTDIEFLKSDNNYILLSGGNSLLLSKNKGETFTILQLGTNQLISSSLIYDEKTLIAGSDKGKLLISNNNGQNWKELSLGSKPIRNIFTLESEVYCYDDNNLFYKLDLINQSFIKTQKPSSYKLINNNIYFFDSNIGIRTSGNIEKTIDGGSNWRAVYNDSISNYRTRYNSFFALDFANDKNGIAVGKYNTIFNTTDGGENWKLVSNFSNFIESLKINVFENGDEDIVFFTSDRFTVFKSTNSGTTFQPTNLFRDTTFRKAKASPIHFFDTNNCIYYSVQDLSLYKSIDAGKSFVNHIPLDTKDDLNPFNKLLNYESIVNVSNSLSLDSNSVYFYRSTIIDDKGIPSKSEQSVYYSLNKGDSWNFKTISPNYHNMNSINGENCFYSCGFFIDSLKSLEQGSLSYSAGALKFNNKFEVIQEMRFPEYLLTKSINFIDNMKGYVLLIGKDEKANLLYTNNGGETWSKIITALDSMNYLTKMVFVDNLLIMAQAYDDFNNKNQTKLLILDLNTLNLEVLEVNKNPMVSFEPTHVTKNYIYFNGIQHNEDILKTSKVYRLKRQDLNTSIEDFNIENGNLATVWLNVSSSNPFSNQTEFTATWLPHTDLNKITIKVYDLNGIVVADLSDQLLSKQFNINQSKIEFVPLNLPTGIYLPVISDGTFNKTITVIYTK